MYIIQYIQKIEGNVMEIVSHRLNNALIEKQGLNQKDVEVIESLHDSMDTIVNILNSLEWNKENREEIFQLTRSIEILEFTLQKIWKFPQDKAFHTHWLRNRHCNCARMDNRDPFYYGGGQIHRGDCKVHGENGMNPELWENLKGREYGK